LIGIVRFQPVGNIFCVEKTGEKLVCILLSVLAVRSVAFR
jgi:hypothetical protein